MAMNDISCVSFETIQNAMDYVKALISEGYPVAIAPMLETSSDYPFEKKVKEYIVYTNPKKGTQIKLETVYSEFDSKEKEFYEGNPN